MKRILRSLVWTEPSEKVAAGLNFRVARSDRLLALDANVQRVLEFLQEFYQLKGEAPQHQSVFDHFEAAADVAAVQLVEALPGEVPYTGASFEKLFDDEVETQAAQALVTNLRTAGKIASAGEKVNGLHLKGTDDAIAYLFSSVRVKPRSDEGRMPASLTASDAALDDLYQKRKQNPHQTYGVPTGYGLIDAATAGIRKKQLFLHAGYGGHLKSTHMFNMIVNAAVDGGWNPVLFTSEMPAEDVKMMLIAIHSGHSRFNGTGARPLAANRLMLGALQPAEEQFYKIVKDDLLHNKTHGVIRVIDSSEFTTWGSVMQRAVREHSDQEVDILWIDYLTRLPVDAKYARMETTAARNETIADAKRFAMSFNNGEGLAVCSPFQVNREGYKRAKASTVIGKMDTTALAQYNAAEKEADAISYIFFDPEQQATSEPLIGLMKVRYGAKASDPVPVYIDPDCRRIFDLTAGMTVQTGHAPTAGMKVEEDVAI